MTYREQRAKLLKNIRAEVANGKHVLCLCPAPVLREFSIYQDFVTGNRFIFHKEEILPRTVHVVGS